MRHAGQMDAGAASAWILNTSATSAASAAVLICSAGRMGILEPISTAHDEAHLWASHAPHSAHGCP